MSVFVMSWAYKVFFFVGLFLIISKKNKFFYWGVFLVLSSFLIYLYDLKLSSENYTYIRKNICGKYAISSPKTSMKGAGKVLEVKINVENYGQLIFEIGKDDFDRDTKGIDLIGRKICVNVNVRVLNGKEDLENVTAAKQIIIK
ncbi:hypothetical protein [Acinetobacter courvalinii]|uniref:hypothetical protein n=1 Tax=Acinetobacter courvalinii TaxID=280147 RepID=UPI0002CF7011|nr:hypothetical protein [Acinetobacter courvalinii]ENX05824.1 hypothetical protein F898_02768 [Acinetobacter courvalinii]MCU4366891.1 hypothetical protein [Acinetobacter courvalinii]MCU4445096.1 hypothetical protein [Acinetobacter courvalinii]